MRNIPGHKNALTTTWSFIRDSEGLIERSAQKYGDSFRFNTLLGDMLVVSDPQDVRTIYSAGSESYVPLFNGVLEPLVGAQSLFMQSGETHKDRRGILMNLLKTKAVISHFEAIQDVAFKKTSELPLNVPFKMDSLMKSVVIEIMIRFVFGEMEEIRVQRYINLLIQIEEKGTPALFLMQKWRKFALGLGPWRSFEILRTELDVMVFEDIRKRRQSSCPHYDFLSKLMSAPCHGGKGMSDEELRDQSTTVILAGFGTTALSLSWAFFWLFHNPSALNKLRDEVGSLGQKPDAEALIELPYLEAVVKESLRINPVVNLTPALIKKEMTFAGHILPPESIVAISIWMAHHREATFNSPEQFIPERFIENKYSPFEFIPFAGGSRRCAGAAFADFEMRCVLATLIQNFDLKLLRSDIPRPINRHLFISPEGGVPMTVIGRCN